MAGGQFFNLFNLGKTPEAMKDLQTKELKNGAHRWIQSCIFAICRIWGGPIERVHYASPWLTWDFVGGCQGAWQCSRSSVCPYKYGF